ncbi:MAG: DNA-processing protein DprA [Candidatus Cellulosilyticum pullistercoris]|uniref:DNA-processing protein DprA n=1 Tax=Candidatus Cellulosilyticum pullistercoris TaxID=2838521 RepID=A0A9E2KAL0_9FIRM|nr:DNA-processing protein DprA [Candidatus Cellulosilyticum pullistercoris]
MSTIYDIWFQRLNASVYIKKMILEKVKSIEEIYKASDITYKMWGLTDLAIARIEASKKTLRDCEAVWREADKEQIEIVGYFDVDYPKLLREIPDPPIVLYVKGHKELLNQTTIGIVGARKCTEYGYHKAVRLGKELSEYNIVVISGMAMGIDAAAHYGALESGTSIGVLGTGVDLCYPNCNIGIYRKLIEKGCLISEYEPHTQARPYHFPRRNRIISGMSYGVVVVEAAARSGSLITAQLALDYGREVYAVPGEAVSKLSKGTNELIESGAKCAFSALDIIEELSQGLSIKNEIIKKNSDKMHNQLAQDERIVYAYVSQEPIFILNLQELLVRTQLSYERINTSLLQLEIKGLIKRLPGERYVRI